MSVGRAFNQWLSYEWATFLGKETKDVQIGMGSPMSVLKRKGFKHDKF